MPDTVAPTLGAKLSAEFIGTFVLVFGGCGSAIFAAKVISDETVNMGIGFLGVALAFGLTVLVMVYAVGHIPADTSTQLSPSAPRLQDAPLGRTFLPTSSLRSLPPR